MADLTDQQAAAVQALVNADRAARGLEPVKWRPRPVRIELQEPLANDDRLMYVQQLFATIRDQRLDEHALADLTERIAALEARIEALAERPVDRVTERVVEWRPDHRRQADGGRAVREQRRTMGLPRRPKERAG
jgi:hypothetical protein